MRRLSCLLGIVLWAGLASNATALRSAAEEAAAPASANAEWAQLLGESPQSDAWLLAAWFAHCPSKAESCDTKPAAVLFDRVLAQPPEDPSVLRVLIGALGTFLSAEPQRARAEQARLLAKVQALDPETLESWLPSLPDAADPSRRAEGVAVLAQAARSTRSGLDYHRVYRWISKSLAGLPPNPLWSVPASEVAPENALRFAAISMTHAIGTPAFHGLTRWCSDPDRSWADDCRAIARLLADGPTLLHRGIGKSLLGRLARNPAEHAEAARAATQSTWLMTAMMHCRLLDDASTLELLDQENVTEILLIEAGLKVHGLPFEAPADPELRKRPCAEIDS